MTRRELLVSAAVLASCRRESAPRPVIDVHVHANFSDPLLQWQAETLSKVTFSAAGLNREMAEAGVEKGLEIGFATVERELSQKAENPMYLEDLNGTKLVAVGGINPYRLDEEGLRRIEEALRAGRLKGLKIYLGYYPKGPDDDGYKRVYEIAGRHKTTVIFHTGDTYSKNARIRFAQPLPVDDVAVEFRQVNFVLAHLGNPWTMDAAELMYKNPNVYADLSGFLVGDADYFTRKRDSRGFEHARERIRQAFAWTENPKKFLYGSDWPLAPMRHYIEFIASAIPAEHHRAVFFDNARELFGLG